MGERLVCSFEGCGRKLKSARYCQSHYLQVKAGKPLTPIRRKRRTSHTLDGKKICTNCEKVKPFADFYKDKSRWDGVDPRCKDCYKEVRSRYVEENEESVKSSILQRTYNINIDQYNCLLTSQNNGCALCGKSAEENGKALEVDHDHSCCPGAKSCGDCVRQLLCSGCNRGLGNFRDDPELLRKAADYIEQHSKINLDIAA